MNIIEYPDREMAAIYVADRLAGELENALFNHDSVSLAVPGGGTPGPIFAVLCAANLDWSRVCVMPTDERFVAEDHRRSNARLIRDRLLTDRAAAARFISLKGESDDPETAAEDAGRRVAEELPLGVLLFGMGTDMHAASLFAGAGGLAQALAADAPPVTVIRPQSQPEPRLTLSAPVLNGALSKHLVIFGADKRAALERAMTLPPDEAPVRALMRDTRVHWAE